MGEERGQKEAYFYKDTIDNFEKFISENLEQMNKDYKTQFKFNPVEEKITCDKCNFKSICIKNIDQGGKE